MKPTYRQFKRIEWAYPTSTNATRFGFSKTGCWCVELQTDNNPPEALTGFANMAEADRFACDIPQTWAPDSKRAFESALVDYVNHKLHNAENLLRECEAI